MKKALALLVSFSLLVLAGCSGSSGGGGTSPGAGGGGGSTTKVKVATISPLSGGQADLGTNIKNGADMAIAEYAEKLKAAGVEVSFEPKDDKADPTTGSQIAEQVLNDKTIVGVVGTLNSGVAKGVAPVLLRDNVVMISPANTGVSLTESNWKNFTRIVFRDDSQGPAAARYVVKTLGAKNVAVLHDKTEYGQGLAEEFVKEAAKQGAKVTNGAGKGEGLDPKASDFSALVTTVLTGNPDVVFYGGIYDTAAPLFKQFRDKGYKGKFMGGDGFDSSKLIELGGDAVKDTYFTSIDADYKSGDGKKFFDNYKAKYGANPAAYAAYGYDAMRVLLEGIIAAAKNGKAASRADVLAAVKATKGFTGIGGKVSFDAKGDNPESNVYVFKVSGKAFEGVGPAPR